ncbi:hypothetical protein MEQU1_001566 [Malassezia equina]|uniref:AP complex subunit beta n=1 Tax=Malassezia equina TaxID=1381935 RepID=A0AAF0EDB0_9BASI|nr:hypothetical protein MEQU1_001566 [Malassezia equina]
MGNDMSSLFLQVVECMDINDLETKKIVYLYLANYGMAKEDLLSQCIPRFLADAADTNPLIRALALRTMSYLLTPEMAKAMLDPVRKSMFDKNPNVRKTAAMCVAKLCRFDQDLGEKNGFVENLYAMLSDDHPMVQSNAAAALIDISEHSKLTRLVLNFKTANKLAMDMDRFTEWGQVYVLELLLFCTPQTTQESLLLADGVVTRLSHTSPSVVFTAANVLVYLMNYVASAERREAICARISESVVQKLSLSPEILFVALRNIQLLVQRRPQLLRHHVRKFFCSFRDPTYIKMIKLDIMYRLANEQNAADVLEELQDYASEVDIDFARRAINAIGRLALKLESMANVCVEALLDIIESHVNYAIQEAIVVIKDILRQYPSRYEYIIPLLCQNVDSLDEPRAKVAMIWIVGEYGDQIDESEEIMEDFLFTFLDESTEIQLALLTATVKYFLMQPKKGADMVQRVLKWSTEQVSNPDCRDRGFFYLRLLSINPEIAKRVVLSDTWPMKAQLDRMDRQLLDQLLLHGMSLSSVYHRLPYDFTQNTKPRYMPDSPALEAGARQYSSSHLQEEPGLRVSMPVTPKHLYPLDVHQECSASSQLAIEQELLTPVKSESESVAVGTLI